MTHTYAVHLRLTKAHSTPLHSRFSPRQTPTPTQSASICCILQSSTLRLHLHPQPQPLPRTLPQGVGVNAPSDRRSKTTISHVSSIPLMLRDRPFRSHRSPYHRPCDPTSKLYVTSWDSDSANVTVCLLNSAARTSFRTAPCCNLRVHNF